MTSELLRIARETLNVESSPLASRRSSIAVANQRHAALGNRAVHLTGRGSFGEKNAKPRGARGGRRHRAITH